MGVHPRLGAALLLEIDKGRRPRSGSEHDLVTIVLRSVHRLDTNAHAILVQNRRLELPGPAVSFGFSKDSRSKGKFDTEPHELLSDGVDALRGRHPAALARPDALPSLDLLALQERRPGEDRVLVVQPLVLVPEPSGLELLKLGLETRDLLLASAEIKLSSAPASPSITAPRAIACSHSPAQSYGTTA